MNLLRHEVPREFFQEFMDTPAARLLNVEVLERRGPPQRWPGKHKHVSTWWILANGRCVGWNENPSRGWSFPVARWRPW